MTALAILEPAPLQIHEPSRNPVHVYLASLAPRSAVTMEQSLRVLAEISAGRKMLADLFPWHSVRPEHVAAFKAALAERSKPATANKHLAALRGVLKAAWRVGLMDSETYHRTADFTPIRGSTLPRGRCLDAGELRSLFASCGVDRSHSGRRDAALLAILYGAGIRRSEAVALDVADFNQETGEIRIREGKGRKERLTYIANGALAAVVDWLAVRGLEPGLLLLPILRGGIGTVVYRRMSSQAVYVALRKRGAQAGLASYSPHDLRRTFVGDLLDAGGDISTVQRLAGHSSVTTTQRYDRRPEQAKRKASGLLHVPYLAPEKNACRAKAPG